MFRADNITIDTGSEQFLGKGMVRICEGRFRFEVTLNDFTNRPKRPTGIIGPSQLWKMRGVIEDEIEFFLRATPSGQTVNYGHHFTTVLPFSIDSIDLVPCGWDTLTTEEREKQSEALIKANQPLCATNAPDVNVQSVDHPGKRECNSMDVRFYAILRDYNLIAFTGQTITTVKNDFLGGPFESFKSDTFHGEFQEWKFALIQREKDIEVYFRSKPEYQSQSEDHDQKVFRAFLNAVAFTHGQHTWPFLTEYRRDGKLVLDNVHLTGNVASTSHSPFTQRLAFDAQVNRLKWQLSDPLEKAFRFFSTDSKLSREITNLLYLFREASASGVPKGITLLSLCSLLESLLHAVYDEQIAPLSAADTSVFLAAKMEAVEAVKLVAAQSQNPTSYDRIVNILTSARPLRPKDKFEAIISHWQLKPKEQWNEVYASWERYRNPLSHRMSEGDESEESIKETLLAESKIAGAINCMILKLMNYSGIVRLST